MSKPWWVYIILCRNGKVYTGVSPDVEARFEKHRKGRGALFTRLNGVLCVLGKVWYESRSKAQSVEHQLKRLHTPEKLQWLEKMKDNDESSESVSQTIAKAASELERRPDKQPRKKISDADVTALLISLDSVE